MVGLIRSSEIARRSDSINLSQTASNHTASQTDSLDKATLHNILS